ncbi:retrovirus-related pol polyprotein from transposon TNT 1-94 [Tanacetum coccineum]
MLSVLISGHPGNDIDVFLEPLVDDLHTLFETGVDTYDVSTKDNFNLRAVVLWTINDYLALGTLCGCPYSGFKGCVVCGKDTNCVRLSASSKQTLIPMIEEQIYNEVQHIESGKIQKQKRNTTEEEGSSSQVNGQNDAYWKKFNIWYQKLRYWRHNSVPHCIDFMHVEKNVAESLVGTLLHVPGKIKDGVNARLDLAELGVKPELFAMQEEYKTTLPPAGYTLTNAEKDTFCETLHNIRVPQGYCSNFSSLVNLKDRKLIGLKSHDYHMLMQEFLPIAIRSIMHPPTRYAIIRNKLEGCIAEETITEETIDFFSEYHKSMETIGIPPDKHETDENKEGKPLSASKSSKLSAELFQKAHLRHKQVLKTENPGKRIAFNFKVNAAQLKLNAAKLKHKLMLSGIASYCWVRLNLMLQVQVNVVEALVDKKKVIITKTSIKSDLKLDDAEGTDYLPTATIFVELERMGLHIAFAACICTLHLQLAFASKHLHIAFADCICTLHLQLAFAHCTCTLHLQAKVLIKTLLKVKQVENKQREKKPRFNKQFL